MDPSPSNEVDVADAELDPPPWQERVAPFCLKVLDRLGIRGWELSVLLCGEDYMRELNRRYRGIDAPTDVLSFAREEEGAGGAFPAGAVGDLVIAPAVMERNASEAGIAADEELKRLLIHGILHLGGMDHPHEDSRMLRLQEELVAEFREEKLA